MNTYESPDSPGQQPIKIIEILKMITPIRHPNDGAQDSICKTYQEVLVMKIKKMYKSVSGERGVPAGAISTLLSYYLESLDIDSIREQKRMDLFPPPSERDRELALKAYEELRTKSIEDLLLMGTVLVSRLRWLMGNYIETWRLQQKLERVYIEGRTTREILKAADEHHMLMCGSELPSGFSMSAMESIRDKMEIIARNSIMAKFMESIQPKHARNMNRV